MCKPILFLKPVFKQMVWGGNRMKNEFGYDVPGDHTAECWGVSAHQNGDCVVREGTYKGKTLSELWKEQPELFGNCNMERFPLLTKIIDAKKDCSIQVHPNDAYAAKYENGSLGKSECWYILDSEEDVSIVFGHTAQTKEELKNMMEQKKWPELFCRVKVKKGDFIQVNPGTVHAITGGLMVLETQQNSDITYRVYDYDRLIDGKPRKLHFNQCIDVITIPAPSLKDSVKSTLTLPQNAMNELISCEDYRVWKLDITEKCSFEQTHPFLTMSVVEGEGTINGQPIRKGDHFILPDGFGRVDLRGEMLLIASSVN